jgi:hypothetical protein
MLYRRFPPSPAAGGAGNNEMLLPADHADHAEKDGKVNNVCWNSLILDIEIVWFISSLPFPRGPRGPRAKCLAVRFYSRANDTPAKKTPQTHRVNGVTSAHKLLIAFKTPRPRG